MKRKENKKREEKRRKTKLTTYWLVYTHSNYFMQLQKICRTKEREEKNLENKENKEIKKIMRG